MLSIRRSQNILLILLILSKKGSRFMTNYYVLFLLLLLAGGAVFAAQSSDDETLGPFPSWLNVKTEFGAVGDGKADDTAALQKALDAIRPAENKRKVLYFPAGTYRITNTLTLQRPSHYEAMGCGLIGEDPTTTCIKWDGPADGIMLTYNPWYARTERLTLDGAGKAGTAILHEQPFATVLQYVDMVIKDVGFGIEAGRGKAGIAETVVQRCKFLRCSKAGISIQDFNTLDWWIWYSTFEDCHLGVTNEFGAGHFHVYESLFLRSTEADMSIRHTSYFGIRNNTSIDSQAFFLAKRAKNWSDKENYGAQLTLQGNTILDPRDVTTIRIESAGNTLLLDNVIRSRKGAQGPVVRAVSPVADSDLISLGNTFTVAQPLEVKGRFQTVDDKVVARNRITAKAPVMPGTLPNRKRKVIEVPPGTNADGIQQAISNAVKLNGQRPVLHFQPGTYNLDHTLVIPANCDVQLTSDGVTNITRLNWTGQGAGPMLKLEGPSHATLREMNLYGNNTATAILLDNCDQPNGRIFIQGTVVTYTKQAGISINNLQHTDAILRDTYLNGSPIALQVNGGARQVNVFSNLCTGDELSYNVLNGGRLLVRDAWYEGSPRGFLHLSGNGEFTLHGGLVAVGKETEPTAKEKDIISVGAENFAGRVALLGVDIKSVAAKAPAQIAFNSADDKLKLLFLGNLLEAKYAYTENAPNAKIVWLHNRRWDSVAGSLPLADKGAADPAFLRDMLAVTRQARPQPLTPRKPGTSDVRIYRLFIENTVSGIDVQAK